LIFNSCIVDDWDLIFNGKLQNIFLFDGCINYSVSSSVLSNDGNVLICGNFNEKISIIKTSVKGNLQWRKNYTIGSYCVAKSVVQTPANDIFVCGQTIQNWADKREDIFLQKLNVKGDSVWIKTLGGNSFDYAECIISTSDGNLLIAGKSESFGGDSYGDIYLVKLNINGEIIWEKTYPDPDQEFSTHVLETPEGEYLVTGNDQVGQPDTANKIYLLKVNAGGNKLWDKRFGSTYWKWAYTTIATADGNFLTCGKLTKDGYSQVLILKTDKNGDFIWERTFGEPLLSETGYSLKMNSDNTFTITGTSFDVNNPDTEIILLKIDENGKELWFQRFGASFNSDGFNLLKYSSQNIVTGNYGGKIFMSFLNDTVKDN